MSDWYVYIIDKKGRFYVGVTTDLENRMRQHRGRGGLGIDSRMEKGYVETWIRGAKPKPRTS